MIKPLNDFVIIQPNETEESTNGGILLLESSQQKPQTGTVIAVGHGRLMENGKRVPLSVEEGHKVIYARYAGTEINHKGHKLLLVREMDILAVFE